MQDGEVIENPTLEKKSSEENIPEQNTPIMFVVLKICELQRLSPTYWLPNLLSKETNKHTYFKQTVTDIFIIVRLIAAIFLSFLATNNYWFIGITSLGLTEMTIAYLSHFFTDKFNSAGPHKVTSARRSLVIMILNFISYIFLFSVLLRLSSGSTALHSIYHSTITITTLGYGEISSNPNSVTKAICGIEALLGMFQMAVVFGSIISWNTLRHQLNEEE